MKKLKQERSRDELIKELGDSDEELGRGLEEQIQMKGAGGEPQPRLEADLGDGSEKCGDGVSTTNFL